MFFVWNIFRRGKTGKKDVMDFEMHLEDNIFSLHDEIKNGTYRHSPYTYFEVFDTKKRDVYKAEVRDRIIHQIIYDFLLACFDPVFITDSYASRTDKGQYKAVGAFRYFIKLASRTQQGCYILKCDVRKYFDNVDHTILLDMIKEKVTCGKILDIVRRIVASYHSPTSLQKGIPLGNITSQVFANMYLNTLDHYIKKELRCRFYVRYNDDFIIVFESNKHIITIRDSIVCFVKRNLLLDIPIEKTSIRKISWGVDFLGSVVLLKAVLLRDKIKNKIYARINRGNRHSYLSLLKHCNAYHLKTKILAMEKIYKI